MLATSALIHRSASRIVRRPHSQQDYFQHLPPPHAPFDAFYSDSEHNQPAAPPRFATFRRSQLKKLPGLLPNSARKEHGCCQTNALGGCQLRLELLSKSVNRYCFPPRNCGNWSVGFFVDRYAILF
jgi:hypothetical protein